ncbi:MAG: gamma-glutamyltransferase [Alphaproteobacteria bacterium]|nr:gamma-glutamyltransferase [Alphaproteobacteria bacterium]
MITSHTTPRRAEIRSAAGVVATGHPVSAETGCRVLADGGNAVDAVIAAAFASFVVEPGQCGIGGHGRMSIHLARDNRTIGIDHFIRAPAGATPEAYAEALRRRGSDAQAIQHTGVLSVGIPGAIAGLCEAQRRFATRPLAALVAPAIALARDGLVVDQRMALQVTQRARDLRGFPDAAALLMPDGLPPPAPSWAGPSARLDGTDLARTLERIAATGAAAFYDGPIAATIAATMRAHGGLLTSADLAAYRPHVFEQPTFAYRGMRYVTAGDLIAVEALNILERFDLPGTDPLGPAARHLFAEALGQAFADAFVHAGDPVHLATPLDGLASKAYAAERAAAIDPARARVPVPPGDPWPQQRREGPAEGARPLPPFAGTTQICAADRDGNVAALITSLGSAFGSLVAVPGTGILLGNAMQWFDPRPGRFNSVGPGRMPLYAAPVLIAFEGDRALGAVVGSGGYRIQTGVLQPLLGLLDHGLAAQAAIEHPRLHSEGDGQVDIDVRVPPATRAALAAMGHRLRVLDPAALGGGLGRTSLVWRDPDGGWQAAAEAWSGGTAGIA